MYQIFFTKQAAKDKRLIAQAGLERRVKALLAVLSENPFQNPPPYEKLVGNLSGFYSRRINYHDWFTPFMRKRGPLKSCGCGRITNNQPRPIQGRGFLKQ
jgi:Txe/YoeB family toxin of toxin-antitoxin system